MNRYKSISIYHHHCWLSRFVFSHFNEKKQNMTISSDDDKRRGKPYWIIGSGIFWTGLLEVCREQVQKVHYRHCCCCCCCCCCCGGGGGGGGRLVMDETMALSQAQFSVEYIPLRRCPYRKQRSSRKTRIRSSFLQQGFHDNKFLIEWGFNP